jgi:hypothetical protein
MNNSNERRRSGVWLRLARSLGLVVTLLTMAASLAVAKTGPAPKPGPGGSASASAATSARPSAVPSGSASAAPSASGLGLVGAESPEAIYQRHLDNGITLFQGGNYRAAVTEFQAAYDAQPKASPLINMALSYKALFDYPNAIDALKKAVSEHADTLKPEHKAAAEKEIRELAALLATVVVAVEPKQATLLLDGLELPAEKTGKPMALSPGPHVLEARMAGYQSATAKLTITAGEQNRHVQLKLAPNQGKLVVIPSEAAAWVEVDGRVPVQSGFEGMLEPGVHSVRVFKHGGKASSLEVVVVAGKTQQVTQDEDGKLVSDAERPKAAPGEEQGEEGERRGFYLWGNGTLFFVGGTQPRGFNPDKGSAGAALGLRVGYRVADWAGFELGGQLSSVAGTGTAQFASIGDRVLSEGEGSALADVKYTLNTVRLGANLRVLAPGRFLVRFIATLGAGIAIDQLTWTPPTSGVSGAVNHVDDTLAPSLQALPGHTSGVGGYGELDLGIEIELSRIIFGLSAQSIIQSTKGLDVTGFSPYDDRPVFLIGPALHVGYGFW